MESYFSFLVFGYVFLIQGYAYLIKKLRKGFLAITDRKTQQEANVAVSFSILVPFRNEEANLGYLLNDLFLQNYPKENFEILLLNDHSDDRSMIVAEEAIKSSSFSKCIFIHPASSGKKAAISEGVKHATGSIIVTIDADCRVGTDWLTSINDTFTNDSVKMVFGPVCIAPIKTVFDWMQAIEFGSLIGSGAATMAYGTPTMSNGANLAFTRNVFHEVNGYEGNAKIASGDDEFLMRKIIAVYPNGVHFNNYQQSIVSTNPQASLSDFIAQRIRWAGKWSAHKDFKSKLLAVVIFLFHLSVIALPFLTIPINGMFALILVGFFLLAKAILECRFLLIVNFWLKVPWSWAAFILLQLSYSLYVVCIGIAALFVRPVWKGRKIKL